jgi:hypothetical protein
MSLTRASYEESRNTDKILSRKRLQENPVINVIEDNIQCDASVLLTMLNLSIYSLRKLTL